MPLQLRIDTHPEPAEQNCTEGILREIFKHLTPQQQDMVQWGLYLPQRAKATYLIPLNKIDLSRSDYAIATIEPTVGINKARVKHPCFIPIQFAKHIIESAKAANLNCPFPTYVWQWKQITKFAKDEYHVKLQSKTLRNFFESIASKTTLPPAIAAFVMGDKTKLNATGHLPLIYNASLRFWDELAQEYTLSGITAKLDLFNTNPIESELERLKRENAELKARLASHS